MLLVRIMVLGPSLSWRRSITSKKRSVHALSNTHLPTSSTIRQDGLASVATARWALPRSAALWNLSPGSLAFT